MKSQSWRIALLSTLIFVLRLEAAATIQFEQTAALVAENAGSVTLSVQRLEESSATVSVDFATIDGTASAGVKYRAAAGNLTFKAGETNKTIVIAILNDFIVGGTQEFQVLLSNPTGGAVLGTRSTATVRITDNDTGLQFEFANYSVAEDADFVLIGVTRGDDGDFPVAVDYATSDVTAISGKDYSGATNTLNIAAGETIKLFQIPIFNDAVKESSKSFRLTLSNPTGGGVLGSRRTVAVTVVDNDPGVQFEFSNYWAGENEGSVTLKVLRGRDTDTESFTVEYATAQGTALPGQDYLETHGTLAFAAGETLHRVIVPVLRNELSTADRQFRLTLSNPSPLVPLGANRTATLTVLDATGMQPHRISNITIQPDRSVALTFEGGVHKRFKDYFDLYPLEISKDLMTWTPWTTLQRTNASTNALTYTVPAQAGAERMFFRTAAGPLITPYRQPTGPYAVGSMTRLVTDTSRRNRYGISTNGSFMVTIWYPAIPEGGKSPDRFYYPWERDNASRSDPFYGTIRSAVTHTFPNASWASNHSRYPVVLYSAGATNDRSQRSELGPNLASHGYVVVAMDHVDVRITNFPDDSVRYGHSGDFSAAMTDANFEDRLKDFKIVVESLAQWNNNDSAFAGHLDLENLGTIGFSWGAGVAAQFARVEKRVKAVVLLDGYLQNATELIRSGLSTPFIGIYSAEGGGHTDLYRHGAATTAVWFVLSSSVHAQFSDYYWSNAPGDLKGGREIARTLNDWILWFLNKHVKGLDEPMPALKDYPRITGFKQK